MGKQWKQWLTLFFGLQNHCRWWLQSWHSKMLAPWKESYDQPRQHIKSRDITLPTKVHLVKVMVFPVFMYGCEGWTIKKAECWRIHALELQFWRRLLSPLDSKDIQPVHPKGNQSWIFIGSTEAETPILWPPDAKSWLVWKDPDAGKDWMQEEKGTTAGVQPRWIQGDSKVGTESASLEKYIFNHRYREIRNG